jgi:hypothetical protein
MGDLWHSLMHSPEAWVIGAVVGLIIFMIFDLLPVGDSRILGLVRFVRNKRSKKSVARLEKRIGEMERYRNTLKTYLISDKAHYLGTLRYMLAVLIFMAIGFSILTLGHMEPFVRLIIPGSFDVMALACFAFAIVVGFVGANISSPDYQTKIEDIIKKADSDIEKLQERLVELQG